MSKYRLIVQVSLVTDHPRGGDTLRQTYPTNLGPRIPLQVPGDDWVVIADDPQVHLWIASRITILCMDGSRSTVEERGDDRVQPLGPLRECAMVRVR